MRTATAIFGATTTLTLSMLVACSGGTKHDAATSTGTGGSSSSHGSSGSSAAAGSAGAKAQGGSGSSGAGNGGSSSSGSGGGNGGGAAGGAASTAGAADAGSGSGNGGSTGTGGSPSSSDQPGSGKLIASAVFYQDIHAAALDSESATLIAALQKIGWGDSPHRTTLGIDFSFEINQADASVARRPFVQPSDAVPDCDTAPVPLPPGGKTEGSASGDYACAGGDCHLLVYQGTRLYELYQSNVTGGMATGGSFTGTCLVIWDLTKDYWKPAAPPNFGRGDHCNGADAGDMPIAPLLITTDELEAGSIPHALRFTISNNRIRSGVYVHPATHIGGPTGGNDTLPYGSRLRLRADYPLASLPNDAARTVARALQTYGMFLADGGNIYLSATTDASSAIGGSALGALVPSDFEMIEGGDRIPWSGYDCTRTPITD